MAYSATNLSGTNSTLQSKEGGVAGELIQGKEKPKRKRLSSRARLSKMNQLELLCEFLELMVEPADTVLPLDEAQDCQFLMERLLETSEVGVFEIQLSESLKKLKIAIAKLRN